MPLSFVRQDITRLHVDAIVNAANQGLRAGGGVCGAIFAAAGHEALQAACDEIGHVDTGEAVSTPGFALPARHIIHTAGPVWHGGANGERELLASCYRNSLRLAASLGDVSVAFPLISSGIYGYPPAAALSVAVEAIRKELEEQPDLQVTLCLFDRRATTLTQALVGEIEQFIDDTYVDGAQALWGDRTQEQNAPWFESAPTSAAPTYGAAPFGAGHARRKRKPKEASPWPPAAASAPAPASPQPQAPSPDAAFSAEEVSFEDAFGDTGWLPAMSAPSSLEEALRHLDAPFSQTLLAMIDERGLTDAQVYTRANLSRQYFSKLRSGSLNPSKKVVVSLAVALGLSLDETRLLLERAGHALTHASKFDVIVEWFIRAGRYDVFEINEALFAFDQPLLGAG